MRRRTPFLAGLFLASLLATPANAATVPDTVTVESQAWWNKAGITVPGQVGSHIHMQATLPTGYVNGVITVPIKITLHNQTGSIAWVRVCRESSPCKTYDITLASCADCSLSTSLKVDVSGWPSGTQEIRIVANISKNGEGARQFQSTGWPIKIRSGTSCNRCSIFWEARGWYTNHGYQNARIKTSPWLIASGGTISVRLAASSSGGLPTKFAGIYIDPDFHAGSRGTVVREWAGPFSGSVQLPAIPSGSHKLVALASDGQNAGVMVMNFVVP